MLIQAWDQEQSSRADNWLWSQTVCSESRPSQKACQTQRLGCLGEGPWKGECSPYCFMQLAG